MREDGGRQKEDLRPNFNRCIMIDFPGAKISSESILRLAIGKGHKMGASQSMLSRLENDVLGNEVGLKALDIALQRSTDALLLKQGKRRLILDVDFTEDPAHGSQEDAAYNVYFGANCFHPLFAFTRNSA